MKTFNTTGICIPSKHYMVDINEQVESAADLVRNGKYFCINRGRQYGKTTTLSQLSKQLGNEGYAVFSISFEGLSDKAFESLEALLFSTLQKMYECVEWDEVLNLSDSSKEMLKELVNENASSKTLDNYFFSMAISKMCKTNNIVLIIDEVDQAGNHIEFIKFLGLLRDAYLNREKRPTFQSIILAGVYDVKNLKLKIRPEEQHQYNSPWNIATPYDADMSLPADGISKMLTEYKSDHRIQFDESFVGQMIYDYTSGYPFLVSRICEIIDTKKYSWDKEGILKATQDLLTERNTLFDDMIKKLDDYPELNDTLKHILYAGTRYAYNPDEKYMQIAMMFNFVKVVDGALCISCRLMETRLYNYFLSQEKMTDFYKHGDLDKNQFVHDGFIDMRLLLERFSIHFNEIYRLGKDDKFIEENGRKIFLTYLRPIINGAGNYYCESRTRDMTRTDVIVDYLGQQYVIKLKVWRGKSYNERGENQLAGYLDFYHLAKGYMVSFCFNDNKQIGVKEVNVGGRSIIEAIV